MFDQDGTQQVSPPVCTPSMMRAPMERYRAEMRRVVLIEMPWTGAVAAVFAFSLAYYLPVALGAHRDPSWWLFSLSFWVAVMIPWFMTMKPMRPSTEGLLRQLAREAEFRRLKAHLEQMH